MHRLLSPAPDARSAETGVYVSYSCVIVATFTPILSLGKPRQVSASLDLPLGDALDYFGLRGAHPQTTRELSSADSR
ncbi:hypothetical protein RRG08_053164 [Elysia crispata]|uniref:Uncharacterized protein n=1 Tax=Elysia crispata TaxID=231223 RepID=A0AAE0YRD6_9GAST|nr:hypothetical protein RRG08_053164 [Elysia crispata]